MRENLDTIGAAIGQIPSGCSVLTVEHEGRSTGLLVPWVQQAAFDPPSITVCVKRGRHVTELIDAAGGFLLNVVGADPTEMFSHFGKGVSPDEDAFAGLDTRTTTFGPLIESCIAHLGCRVTQKVPVGDHDLYVGEVLAGGVVDGTKPYMRLRKTGLSY